MKVVIQSRVSTSIQDNKRQVDELLDYSRKNGFEVLQVFEAEPKHNPLQHNSYQDISV